MPIFWKKGETKQKLIVTVRDARGNIPDFSGSPTVTFRFKTTGGDLISKTGAVEDATLGKLSWTPAADESDYGSTSSTINGAKDYQLEVKVVWSDARESIYPTKGTATLSVQDVLS